MVSHKIWAKYKTINPDGVIWYWEFQPRYDSFYKAWLTNHPARGREWKSGRVCPQHKNNRVKWTAKSTIFKLDY